MNILFDTNIVVNINRARDPVGAMKFVNPDGSLIYLSIVSEAEIKSLAIRKKWGDNRMTLLNNFLGQANVMEVNQLYINSYTEIDT